MHVIISPIYSNSKPNITNQNICFFGNEIKDKSFYMEIHVLILTFKSDGIGF